MRSLNRLPQLLTSLIIFFFVVVAWPPASAVEAADQEEAALPLRSEIIVKLKPAFAASVEAALPDTLQLNEPAKRVRPDWFQKYRVTGIRPLHRALIQQKKNRRLSMRQIADQAQSKNPNRILREKPDSLRPDISQTYILELPDSTSDEVDRIVEQLKADPEIEFAQRDRPVKTFFTPNDPFFSSTGSWGQTFADLYGVKAINCQSAWDINIGSGTVVAVVDTGIDYNHVDISSNVWINVDEVPGNGIDEDGNGYVDDVRGWDFVQADNNPKDDHGHGTHVAGTIAAVGNNGTGVIGVAWDARVMAVKALNQNGAGYESDLANAIAYAANNGADVINASWGGKGMSSLINETIDYANSLGAAFVAAAGNDGLDASQYFPANCSGSITVSAIDSSNYKAGFSNCGKRLDVAAPGVDILSLRAVGTSMGTSLSTDTNYTRASGTSMAAPHVSGVAALILSLHPDYNSEQVRQVLRKTATDVWSTGIDTATGYGKVNASNALQSAYVLESRMLSPLNEAVIAGTVSIEGVAKGTNFSSYTLDYGAGDTPATWTTLATGGTPVNHSQFAPFNSAAMANGRYTVRLRTYNTMGVVFEDQIQLTVRNDFITTPARPRLPSLTTVYKPGVALSVSGIAGGLNFQSYRVEWAKGIDATNGWSAAGISLVGGGSGSVSNGLLATWNSGVVTQADYYTIRLAVNKGSFTNESKTYVYLEPDLISTNWPYTLEVAPFAPYGVVPAMDAQDHLWLGLVNLRIMVSSATPQLWSFSADGAFYRTNALTSGNRSQPIAVDLDGVAGQEVLVVDGTKILTFDADGAPRTNIYSVPSGTIQQFTVADLTGDGRPEIVAFVNDWNHTWNRIYAWNANGVPLGGQFPITVSGSEDQLWLYYSEGSARLLLPDLDGDGRAEIVVAVGGSSTFTVKQFKSDGTPGVWADRTINGQFTTLAGGDFNHDGRCEVLLSYKNSSGGSALEMLSPVDGTPLPGWPVSESGQIAVADLDRDGTDEIIVASASRLCVLRTNGASYSAAWPVVRPTSQVYQNFGRPIVADIDGDGFPEILVSLCDTFFPSSCSITVEPYSTLSLRAYRSDATIARTWNFFGISGNQPSSSATPMVGDFDGNGTVDLAVNYATIDGGGVSGWNIKGVISVLSLNTPYVPYSHDWPVNFHDPQSTYIAPTTTPGAPAVRIVCPTNGAVVASGSVGINALASDDVRIAGVQFKVNGVSLGTEDTKAPYWATWNASSASNGVYTLSASARDNDGNETTASITVTVQNDVTPPSVSIFWPEDGSTVTGIQQIYAIASDNVGVAGVQFRLDGVNLGSEITGAPYSLYWNFDNVSAGAHTLSAIARDAAGNTATTSIAVNVVHDTTPPEITISAPGDGDEVSGVIQISADATDDYGVSDVYFEVSGGVFYDYAYSDPYTVTWNTETVQNGTYQIYAIATDLVGNQRSTNITVTVANQIMPPTVSFVSPIDGETVAGTVDVWVDAFANAGIAGVQYKLNAENLGPELQNSYLLEWDTTTVTNGLYELGVVVRDTVGNETTAAINVIVSNDVVAPAVIFTTPTNGTVVTGSVTVSANASDNVGVAGVQFKLDGVNFGSEDTVTPYALTWNTTAVTNGSHSLSAVARDAVGNQSIATIVVIVNNDLAPPVVSIVSPTNGSMVAGTIDISANASDNVGVVGVQFKLDGVNFGVEDAAAPYTVTWNTLTTSNGSHTISSIARDAAGNQTTASAVTVTVNNDLTAPTVSITLPTNGAVVAGTINLSANAADNVGVAGVQFKLDGANLGSEDTAFPYAISWDTLTVTDGSHTLSAVARDAAGNVATASTITVNVNNLAAPSGLTVTAVSTNQLNLSWTDNAISETGFAIERSNSGGAYVQVGATSANVTNFQDSGLSPNTTYSYRVAATNAVAVSPYSNITNATTFPMNITVTFVSIAAEDGRVQESNENSNSGGSVTASDATTSALRTGDDSNNRQLKTILSFDTSSIPDGAVIVSATLRMKRGSLTGTSPFTTHGSCFVDIRNGTGFNNSVTLENQDFQAAASAAQVASMSAPANNGDVSSGIISATGLAFIDKTGRTQFRIYFSLDDNNDKGADYIGWYAGDDAAVANRPTLEITYQ